MIRLIHVTRLPPSPSGVSLYARDLDEAYAILGDITSHRLPPDPRASQSLPLAMRTWWRLRRTVKPRSSTVISFELAGRGIAEMWAAWILARSDRRVWVTVHDIPTLCGASLLTRTLDHRGARRWGLWLSRNIGRRAERDLLQRAELVFALSRSGANALRAEYGLGRPVIFLPHVVASTPTTKSEPRILVPGYVGGIDPVRPLLHMLPALPPAWRLVVGATSDSAAEAITELAAELGVTDAVDVLGFVDEDALDREFARAAIVVRWRPEGWLGASADYAVSGPLIRALGRGCAIVTNDRRGALECLRAAGATVVGDGEEGAVEMCNAVDRYVHDAELRQSRARTGLAHVADDHSPKAVAARIAEVIP